MKQRDPRVPDDVEALLVGNLVRAGQLGGAIGDGRAGVDGAERGARRAGNRLPTVVADCVVRVTGSRRDLLPRLRPAFPRALQVDGGPHVVRLVVPIGRTGLQAVVVDIGEIGAESLAADELLVRAYGKEGLLSRSPTKRTAEQVAAVLAG